MVSEHGLDLDEANQDVVDDTNMEVGEMVLGTKSLSCVLVLVMEDWPDWLMVLAQIKVQVHVFCDWNQEDMQKWLEGGVKADSWRSVDEFWRHELLAEPNVCVLLSGSHSFVEGATAHISEGAPIVAAIAHKRRGLASGHSNRLRWRTV